MIKFDSELGRYVVWNEHDKEIKFTFNIEADKESNEKKESDVWKMMETISEFYDVEDLEEAFGCCALADAICSYSLEDFIKTFEAYEKERKIIHVGDEVKWAASPRFDPTCGVVIAICDGYYTVLTNSGGEGGYFYTRAVMTNDPTLRKTGSRFPISAKEES